MARVGGFLTAEWRYLAMLNYEIDPAVLRPRVPAGTELDRWEGRTFVSVVGFLFLQTRVLGWSVPFHRDFEEVNLRFYVRRKTDDGWRRGVVFIKEIVPRRAIAAVARLAYNEHYVAMAMRHVIETEAGSLAREGAVEYGWRSGSSWSRLRVGTVGAPRAPVAGSAEAFITDHYWGYTTQRDGGTVEYRVEHPPWRVWQVGARSLECDVAGLYGAPYVGGLTSPPASAFLAEGSGVVVGRGVRI